MSSNGKSLLHITANAFNEIKAWKTATLVLAAVSGVLAFALINAARTTPIILVPHDLATTKKEMVVPLNGEIKGTSQEYIANVALGDLSLILNFTPENVITQHQRFLNRVTDDLYGTENERLMAQAQEAKSKNLTQSFYPLNVEVSTDDKANQAVVTVKGTQIRYLGGKEITRASIAYLINYKLYKGFLHVANLNQTTK